MRILDVGIRPLYSFPEALGITAEVHPFGGNFTIEGGVGISPLEAFTWNAAAKYRFPVYSGDSFRFSPGPGALDAGVAHPVYDAPTGAKLGTFPVFNGSIGIALRL